jgi:hypothetical protein
MKRLAKRALMGAGVMGIGLATYHSAFTQDGTFDLNNVAVVRVGRAALTVRNLKYRNLSPSIPHLLSLIRWPTLDTITKELCLASGQRPSSLRIPKVINSCGRKCTSGRRRSCSGCVRWGKRCDARPQRKLTSPLNGQINGGCFVKVGQHVAALDYLLPSEYVDTMKPLRSNAPEMPIEDVKKVIREDLDVDVRVFYLLLELIVATNQCSTSACFSRQIFLPSLMKNLSAWPAWRRFTRCPLSLYI